MADLDSFEPYYPSDFIGVECVKSENQNASKYKCPNKRFENIKKQGIKINYDKKEHVKVNSKSQSSSASRSQRKPHVTSVKRQTCFTCGIAGHIARNCKNSIQFSAKIRCQKLNSSAVKRQICFTCGTAGHIARNCVKHIYNCKQFICSSTCSTLKKRSPKIVNQVTPKVASAKKGVTKTSHKKTRSDYDWNVAKKMWSAKVNRKHFVHSSRTKQNTFSKTLNRFHQKTSNQNY